MYSSNLFNIVFLELWKTTGEKKRRPFLMFDNENNEERVIVFTTDKLLNVYSGA